MSSKDNMNVETDVHVHTTGETEMDSVSNSGTSMSNQRVNSKTQPTTTSLPKKRTIASLSVGGVQDYTATVEVAEDMYLSNRNNHGGNNTNHANRWRPEEDEIIIKAHKDAPRCYAKKAQESMPGRSVAAIQFRWQGHLRKHHVSTQNLNKPKQTCRSWTPEEDQIIVEAQSAKQFGYATEAAKRLSGRSTGAIMLRWQTNLAKRYPNLARKTCVPWTPDEDNTIVEWRKKKVHGYAAAAVKDLPGRTIQAIRTRWNVHLRFQHTNVANNPNLPVPDDQLAVTNTAINVNDSHIHEDIGRENWSVEEEAIILREHKTQYRGYAIEAAKYLPGRSADAIRRHWNKYMKPQHVDEVLTRRQWTAEEDATIMREHENNKGKGYAAEAAKFLEGRSVSAIRGRWNVTLKNAGPGGVIPPNNNMVSSVPPSLAAIHTHANIPALEPPTISTTIIVTSNDPPSNNNDDDDEADQIEAETVNTMTALPTVTTISGIGEIPAAYNSKRVIVDWTPDEDAIIVRERKNGRGYAQAAAKQLPNRSVNAIRVRWNHHLKDLNSDVEVPQNKKRRPDA